MTISIRGFMPEAKMCEKEILAVLLEKRKETKLSPSYEKTS